MKTAFILCATSALASVWLAGAARADEVQMLDAPVIPLADVTFKSGQTTALSVGYGSGATHRAGEDAGLIYTITDRGPNIACDEAKDLTGADTDAMCAGDKDGKIFPVPAFDPTIYALRIEGEKVSVAGAYPLLGTDGKKLSGISVPLAKNPTEKPYAADGSAMAQNPNGFDSESLARLADGSFWISDEYGPSISHVAADGKVLDRLVPAGTEGDYAQADYPVHGKLPAILVKRELNRGLESIAVSPDEATLYFVMQSPLANPDEAAFKSSRLLRLFSFDRKAEAVKHEYVYQIDTPDAFKADNAKKARKQEDVKVSEMAAIGPDRLLVLERISKTTLLYEVDLAGATPLPARFDDVATKPSLEQLKSEELAAAGIVPLKKTLIFNSDDHAGMPDKIEGVAVIDPKTLVLVTDNDFGIDGAKTKMVRVTLDKPLN